MRHCFELVRCDDRGKADVFQVIRRDWDIMDEYGIEMLPLQASHIADAARLLAEAFCNDPGVLAIMKINPEKRKNMLRGHYATNLEINLRQNVSRVAVIDGRVVGVLQLTAPGKNPATGFDIANMLWRAIFRTNPVTIWRGIKGSLDDESHRPKKPNYYLETLGVDTELHGRGIGSMMLSYITDRADKEGVGIYLSSTEPKALPLYERFGFKTISKTDQSGAPNWHMAREPK